MYRHHTHQGSKYYRKAYTHGQYTPTLDTIEFRPTLVHVYDAIKYSCLTQQSIYAILVYAVQLCNIYS